MDPSLQEAVQLASFRLAGSRPVRHNGRLHHINQAVSVLSRANYDNRSAKIWNRSFYLLPQKLNSLHLQRKKLPMMQATKNATKCWPVWQNYLQRRHWLQWPRQWQRQHKHHKCRHSLPCLSSHPRHLQNKLTAVLNSAQAIMPTKCRTFFGSKSDNAKQRLWKLGIATKASTSNETKISHC